MAALLLSTGVLTLGYLHIVIGSGCQRRSSNLYDVPDDIPDDCVKVTMDDNNIRTIKANAFSNLKICSELKLDHNSIMDIELDAFNGLEMLHSLYLYENHLTEVKINTFQPLGTLNTLDLRSNDISILNQGSFKGLNNTRFLRLGKNKLKRLKAFSFEGLPVLDELELSENTIYVIDNEAFSGLVDLQKLYLAANNIKIITRETFPEMPSLKVLALDRNEIDFIENDALADLRSLNELYLQGNNLTGLDPVVLSTLNRPLSLGLGDSRIPQISRNSWSCKPGLCWLKQEEDASRISFWYSLDRVNLIPACVDGIDWETWTCGSTDDGTTCPDPGSVEHSVRQGATSATHPSGTIITYSCTACYSGGGTVTCQGDGTWTAKPTCTEVTCENPGPIDNGEIQVNSPTSREDLRIKCGVFLTYSCNLGFRLSGSQHLTCTSRGQWDSARPQCLSEDGSEATTSATTPEENKPSESTSADSSSGTDMLPWILVAVFATLALTALVFILIKTRGKCTFGSGNRQDNGHNNDNNNNKDNNDNNGNAIPIDRGYVNRPVSDEGRVAVYDYPDVDIMEQDNRAFAREPQYLQLD